MIWLAIIVMIVALDQGIKYGIVQYFDIGAIHPVINGFFYLTHHENTGAAWSILQGGRWFFIIITIIICSVLVYLLFRSDNKLLTISLSFIIGGALGNLIDRVWKGSVTDFLEFHFGSYIFPVFNIADSFVVVGTILLAFYLLFFSEKEKQPVKGQGG